MIYLDIRLDHCEGPHGTTQAVYPHVNLSVDVNDAVDFGRLRAFSGELQQFLYKGINDCLDNNNNNQERKQI